MSVYIVQQRGRHTAAVGKNFIAGNCYTLAKGAQDGSHHWKSLRFKTKRVAPLGSNAPKPFANSSLHHESFLKAKLSPLHLPLFPKWKKCKAFTATTEGPPQLSFFTSVISVQKGCHHNVCEYKPGSLC